MLDGMGRYVLKSCDESVFVLVRLRSYEQPGLFKTEDHREILVPGIKEPGGIRRRTISG